MTKDHSKKASADKGSRQFKFKRPSNKGKSTIQILSTSSGTDKLYNGGSPIQFNAVKATIINGFKSSNSYRFIHFLPGTAAEDIVETTFDEPMPTEAEIVDQPIAAELADHLALYQTTVAAYQAIDNMNGTALALKMADANIALVQAQNATNHKRVTYLAQFDRRLEQWNKNRKEYATDITTVMKDFIKHFGPLTLSQVKPFLDENRFRRAWFEINAQNSNAAAGQNNTSILLEELLAVKYDASIKHSFAAMESTMTLLQDQLVALGEPAPTEDSKLYQLIRALKASPGNEFKAEIKHVEMTNQPYLAARTIFVRRDAELSSNKVFKQCHRQSDDNEEDARLGAAIADRKQGGGAGKQPPCNHCGKTNHKSDKCFTLMKCDYCGKKGHPAKYCRSRIRDEKNEEEGDSHNKTQSSNGSVSVGSRFNGNNKKDNAYSDELVVLQTDAPYVLPESNVTDHRISSVVAFLLNTHHRLNVSMSFRIIIDSGASSHMLPRSMLCSNYRQSAGIVRLGDTSKTLSIKGKGNTTSEYIVDVLNVQDLSIR